ncbi:unnamed protein product [Arctia plantaginis]|uniref:DUF4817 domain-containing protein n=1 Tax=Arctia plantaginis TaxID=874455 RepID=A0A8S1BJQ5_ARCPL|nr:unnamed protein product [Arctia plantaginis]
MERYTHQERGTIVSIFLRNNSSVVLAQREFRRRFPGRPAPTAQTLRRLATNLEEYGTTRDAAKSGRPRSARSAENIAAVAEDVELSPETSTRRRASQLAISRSSLRRILVKDLRIFPYKVQSVHHLLPVDRQTRVTYAQAILNLEDEVDDFSTKIIMSDEAHFHLNGYVNKQNYRFWGTENPRVMHEEPLHPLKVTAWCAVHAGGVIGPFFFEDAAGQTTTVDGARYRAMLTEFFLLQLNELGLEDMWFQQDGATAHTARATTDILKTAFPGRLISRFGDLHWPARSPDLTVPDFFLWGFLKSRVYVNKPETLEALKDNIRHECKNLSPEVLAEVMKNAIKRARIAINCGGAHLTDIIFST